MSQSETVPPSLWPPAVAALSAWLGIGSAEYTVAALGPAAVLLSLAVASALFLVFMYFAPPAERAGDERRSLRLAAGAAWIATIYSTWLVEHHVQRSVGSLAVGPFSLVLGAVAGGTLAAIVYRIGMLPARWRASGRAAKKDASLRPPRVTPFAQPTLAAAWPAIAAGAAALVGMDSCMLTMVPLTMFGAPVAAVLVAAGLFRLLLPLASVPDTDEGQDARLRGAAGTAWIVSIATCWLIAARFSDVVIAKGGAPSDNGVAGIGLMTGVVLGGFVAQAVRRVGTRYMRGAHRRACCPRTEA